MSVFTFAEAIGQRTRLQNEELDFLLKEHKINENEAFKIMQTMGFSLGRTIQNQNEFWKVENEEDI